ncbi:insulinase family protein, partial [bacterium]|nr:insulinase family protein [bacterium]
MLRATICLGGALLLMTAHSYAADVHEYRLDNGLLVLLKENHNAPVINFNVVYRVGSKYERPGITGISHLLEHMMFKTTKNLELGEFDRRLKEVGSDNNAYTWLDQTVYYETIAAGKIDVALELEAERMRYLLCLPEDHELEMPVVRNELEQRDDSPFTLLSEELFANAFKAHPYRVPTIGWVDDVESITSEEIKAHYDRYYNPDNAFLVLVGDFEPDEMYAKIQRHFGGIPSGDVRLPRISKEPEQIGERRFEIRKAGQLDFILAGWHIPESEHPDSYALVVLGNILGEGRTSRLYRALVDTGKCAAAGAWSSAFGFADPFLFLVNGVVSPGETPAGVEPIYYEEIEKIITGGVTDEELARARKQARVSFVFEKDSIVSEARSLVSFELMSGWRDLDNYLPGIEAVTNDDLMRVAAKYLTKQNRTVGIWHA